MHVTNSGYDSGEVISQKEEPADYDSKKEIKSDAIEKSDTLNPPENIPVITKFVDVNPENPLDKLPPTRDTQLAIDSELEAVIYQVDKEACEVEDIEHSCARYTPAIHLPNVSIAFSQLGEKNNEKGIVIVHTLTKLRDKNCKVNMNRSSCINAVFSELIEKDGLKTLPPIFIRTRCHGLTSQS